MFFLHFRAFLKTKSHFAEDIRNLTLASPSLNRDEKSGHDAGGWLVAIFILVLIFYFGGKIVKSILYKLGFLAGTIWKAYKQRSEMKAWNRYKTRKEWESIKQTKEYKDFNKEKNAYKHKATG